jgi:alkylation response protein AidB-like acyl-CoA dehydrogenase
MATLLEAGTEEQKLRHVPAILRGEELWVQFLSEPSGGSDLAGCLTRADRDGDVFMMSGSKIWSSGAYVADYAMCLARTNWDVPKHRGLTMFIVKIHQPGVTVEQIRQVDGTMEFCQEFFDEVPVPVADVVGEIDDGWAVANLLLVQERLSVGGGSAYTVGRVSKNEVGDDESELVELMRSRGLEQDRSARQTFAEAAITSMVGSELISRVSKGMATGALPPSGGSLMKLYGANAVIRRAEIGLTLAGEDGVAWSTESRPPGSTFGAASLGRQGIALGGGSNEIQRNIISERMLGMPREAAADREIPYKDVPRGGR